MLPVHHSDVRYIAIEGVIGAGKTSLAKMVSERINARLVLEQFEENPFLERFYEDSDRYAFQTQIFFLLSRYKQQQDLFQADLFHNALVTDYIFEKDKIFAYLNLRDDELRLYETLVGSIEKNIPVPDLVVYLHAGARPPSLRVIDAADGFNRFQCGPVIHPQKDSPPPDLQRPRPLDTTEMTPHGGCSSSW